jgi:hypothetical protein
MSGGLRKRPHRPYEVRVPSTTVRDTEVSYRALGALTWILDQAEGWDIRSEQMATTGKRSDGTGPRGKPHKREGREAIRTALRELAAAGYYRLERRRMLDGTMTMGTAVSFTPVDSWAEQAALFGQKAVPVVEQPDGSYWVRYPDGTLQPDDWPAPNQQPSDVETPDPAAASRPPQGDDVSAGENTSGPPAPENPSPVPPGPRNPAPGKAASGEPASGNTSPLVSTSMSGFHKGEETSPPPPTAAEVEAADPPAKDQDQSVDEVLTAAPHWSRQTLVATLAEPDMADRARRDPAAFRAAVLAVATGRYGHTASPRRLLEAGPWWADAHGIPRQTPAPPRSPAQTCGCLRGVILVEEVVDGIPTGKDRPQPCPACSPTAVAA